MAERPDPPSDATLLLRRLGDGDRAAAAELMPLLYGELHRVAARCMQGERAGHTLQPTALVHEAWLRLVNADEQPSWESRAHFVRVAARAMRNVLVDHARSRSALKRGGPEREQVPLDGLLAYFEERALDVVALNEALEGLLGVDDQLVRIVELRFFAGLTIEETARVLDVSTPTVERGWRVARMWLRQQLEGGVEDGP